MLFESKDPPAVPLWVNGHAFLTMAPAFHDVLSPSDGRVLRRTPLCSGDIAATVMDVAMKAGAGWRALAESERGELCLILAGELERYSDHVCGLIVDETGKTSDAAGADVATAVKVLRQPNAEGASKEAAVVAIVCNPGTLMAGPLKAAVGALIGGATVIVKPDPAVPSALVALGELTGRCGFPPGVFNVLHGGKEVVDGLLEVPGVQVQFV
jgi:acyl-CoA reductase-like NAD-dependent aldehyde dehydrogenase